tara:strand:- start:840 stop:1163 length:324 start_codon:yes stop_codon:yes gene_type:complete
MKLVSIFTINGGIMKKLIEVMQNSTLSRRYSLREVFVNPEFVVSLVPDTNTKRLLSEGRLPEDLSNYTEFTRVTIHKGATGQEMVVVGDIATVRAKLFSNPKNVLRG